MVTGGVVVDQTNAVVDHLVVVFEVQENVECKQVEVETADMAAAAAVAAAADHMQVD